MNRAATILFALLLTFVTLSSAVSSPQACWSFENNFTDEFNNYGAPVAFQSNYTSAGKVGYGGYFTANEMDLTNYSFYGKDNYTLSLWYNAVTTGRADVFGGQVDTHSLWVWDHQNNVNYLGLSVIINDVSGIAISPQQWSSSWYHLFIVGFKNDTQYLYVNGSYVTPGVGTSVGKAMNDVNG